MSRKKLLVPEALKLPDLPVQPNVRLDCWAEWGKGLQPELRLPLLVPGVLWSGLQARSHRRRGCRQNDGRRQGRFPNLWLVHRHVVLQLPQNRLAHAPGCRSHAVRKPHVSAGSSSHSRHARIPKQPLRQSGSVVQQTQLHG